MQQFPEEVHEQPAESDRFDQRAHGRNKQGPEIQLPEDAAMKEASDEDGTAFIPIF